MPMKNPAALAAFACAARRDRRHAALGQPRSEVGLQNV
jgi:hypothetical protein